MLFLGPAFGTTSNVFNSPFPFLFILWRYDKFFATFLAHTRKSLPFFHISDAIENVEPQFGSAQGREFVDRPIERQMMPWR
jgi:hypothetical protein